MAVTRALQAAVALADLGLAVFPVRRGRKDPAVRDWQFLATTDSETAARTFRSREGCNIGVATGAKSGAFVLDIDCKEVDGNQTLAQLEEQNGRLPETWTAQTPSGGRHLWFALPQTRRVGNRVNFAPSLDIRGEGGFVVVPPSVVGSGYRWIHGPSAGALAAPPTWLVDLAAPLPSLGMARPLGRSYQGGQHRIARYVAGAVAAELRRVASAPAGQRNQALFQAAANLGELVGAKLLQQELAEQGLSLAAQDCGLVRDDGSRTVLATIASGLRRGMASPRKATL